MSVEVISPAPFEVKTLRNAGDYAELNACYGRLFGVVLAELLPR